MISRLVDRRRAAELLRRHEAIALLAALVIIAFAALAAIGATDRRSDEARAKTASAEVARATFDRQQRMLEQLAAVAAGSADETTQLLLNRIPSLTPETRAAAVYDPSGMMLQRSASGIDQATLATIGADAAKQAAARPAAAMLEMAPVRVGNSGATLIGLAHPWRDADGKLAGIALVVLDHSTLGQFGTPLLANANGSRGPAIFPARRGAYPFVAVAAIGTAAMLGLLAVLKRRLDTAEREITRHTAVERELRDRLATTSASADRTDELSRAKSRFFTQVTHELRTPLNAILGFSETIRHEMFGPLANSRYLEYAGLIHDAGSHLLSLINDLLDNARLEAGKMQIAPIRVAPGALARSALDLVELLATGRDIAIATFGIGECPDLNIDPRAMKQVLVNLLSNAIKYTPPGGRIDLRFAARDDGGAQITIIDTGIGMSAEDLRRAFEPFGRANAIEARRQQGTGLGLSLARALVRLHGGDLTLASRIASGTTATVILPASAAFSSRSALPADDAAAAA
jgi:signal transduction histidine kinase